MCVHRRADGEHASVGLTYAHLTVCELVSSISLFSQGCKVVWQWFDGHWSSYPAENSQLLEKAYLNGETSIRYSTVHMCGTGKKHTMSFQNLFYIFL